MSSPPEPTRASILLSTPPPPGLPPLLPTRPYVAPEDHLPYVLLPGREEHSITFIPQPELFFPPGEIPVWYDNLQPLIAPGLVMGMAIGGWRGVGRRAARFTAENAHRKPGTVKGWFYYKRAKGWNVILGGFSQSFKYGLRFSALIASYSLLSTAFQQSFVKAKSWRDEDRLARSLVRNYDGLGNARTPDEEKARQEEIKKEWGGKLWPNEDGFDLWDWVGAVGSSAAAGGILTVGLGLYRHWYPPTIVMPALFAMLAGGVHGGTNLYAARERKEKRDQARIVAGITDLAASEAEAMERWEEVERMRKAAVERRLKEASQGLPEDENRWGGKVVAWLTGRGGAASTS